MRKKQLFRFITAVVCVVGSITGSYAAEEANQTNQLIRDLELQIQRAERERLADPWFLRDLRQILGRYDNPWQRPVLMDDFSGPGPKPAAHWTVRSGEFLIDWRHGLRSVVQTVTQPAPKKQQQKADGEDIAAALFGAFLEQAINKDGNKRSSSSMATTNKKEPAWMQAPVTLSNAFALSFKISQRALNGSRLGEFMIGPYTSREPEGYRLFIHTGTAKGQTSLQLVRYSSNGGAGVVELYQQPLNLADGKIHDFRWTRDRQGVMQVILDGKTVIQAPDRSVRQDYVGLEVSNKSGDFALRELKLHAAN